MKDFECSWCDSKNKITAMVSGHEMPVICKCGTMLGYIDYKDLRDIIKERNHYKELYLTKSKG